MRPRRASSIASGYVAGPAHTDGAAVPSTTRDSRYGPIWLRNARASAIEPISAATHHSIDRDVTRAGGRGRRLEADDVRSRLREGLRRQYDLICFVDCLHDMGDPIGIAGYAREHLEDDGTVLLVEPFALENRTQNIGENPMAPLRYTASSAICTPNSLSQEVGLGIGAQAGPGRLREVLKDAGFTRFRVAAETPMNLVIEARP